MKLKPASIEAGFSFANNHSPDNQS